MMTEEKLKFKEFLKKTSPDLREFYSKLDDSLPLCVKILRTMDYIRQKKYE